MKRVIIDLKKVTPEILALLVNAYPDGYDDHIISFKNAKNDLIEAVEVTTEDTKYLVKVSTRLRDKMADIDVMTFAIPQDFDMPSKPLEG